MAAPDSFHHPARPSVVRAVRRAFGILLGSHPRDSLAMFRAALSMAMVEVMVRRMSLPVLCDRLGISLATVPREEPAPVGLAELSPRAQALVHWTYRVADAWPFAKGPCLRRSLVSGRLLRSHRPVMRLGVIGTQDSLRAHAWIEVDGLPLEDISTVTEFGGNSFVTPFEEAGQ